MSNIIYPDTTELKKEYNLKYKELILKANNWKIGDEITCEFEYDQLASSYFNRRETAKYNCKKEGSGILKEDENGFLYAESLNDYPFYFQTSNGLSGRSRKEWYRQENKKSIRKFYNQFLFS